MRRSVQTPEEIWNGSRRGRRISRSVMDSMRIMVRSALGPRPAVGSFAAQRVEGAALALDEAGDAVATREIPHERLARRLAPVARARGVAREQRFEVCRYLHQHLGHVR